MADPRLATVTIVAIPVTPDAFKGLPDYKRAQKEGGYPAVLVENDQVNPLTVGPRAPDSAGHFGLPAVPVLCIQDPGEAPPPSGEIVESARELWEEALRPVVLSLADWKLATQQAPVRVEAFPVGHAWPRLVPRGDAQENEEGMFNFSVFSNDQ